ncbi:MAG: hypothetical protein A2X46_09975 [Lentisphaerae bacterium GWF2_57_35]|nr:MAG: hypothetical protein A2X46_09975 [Lentisphaerae bacterium GWF2_57_35]
MLRVSIGWLALYALLAGAQAGELSYPLYIGNAQPIQDEFGRNLLGACTTAIDQCDRVEVLISTDGQIYPPASDGTPDPRNILLEDGVTAIGNHTSAELTNSGLFGFSIKTNKPLPGTKLFVRAFNAKDRGTASFYGDSAIINLGFNAVYIISITNMIALDSNDGDGEGMNNSWEKSLGTDPNKADTDGDGLSDDQERRAGTDPLDAQSSLVMAEIRLGSNNRPLIAWASVEGKRYQLEYTGTDLRLNPTYVNVSLVITAAGAVSEVSVSEEVLNQTGQYRVRLVEN